MEWELKTTVVLPESTRLSTYTKVRPLSVLSKEEELQGG